MTKRVAEALAPQKLGVAESVLPLDPITSLSLNPLARGEEMIERTGIGEVSGPTSFNP